MNCFLSFLHFILWDPWLHLWSFEHMERYQTPRLFSVAFQIFCNQFQFFRICFFLALLGLLSIRFLFPVVPLDLFRFCESHVSRMHSTWWDHTLLSASHPAVPIEKRRARGRVQMPRPLLGGGGKCGRGITLRHGAACLPRRGAPVLCLHLESPQHGPPQQSMHAAVGITHISWGSCVGKARTWHGSGQTQTWVSLQEKIGFRLRSFKHSL